MELTRRALLHTTAVLGTTAVAGCGMAPQVESDGNVLFAAPLSTIPVVGTSQLFSVRRIYCVGRNYAAHAREMGSDPTREPPFFFQKPRDAIQVVAEGVTIDHPYPPMTKNYHYEVELVAALGKGGRKVSADAALALVYGYAVGLDMTRRDLQRMMGDQQKPWELGKAFDRSAVDHSPPPGRRHRTSRAGGDLAEVERRNQAVERSEQDDLERRGADREPVPVLRALRGRHHLLGHARKRRPGCRGRRPRGARGRALQSQRSHCLIVPRSIPGVLTPRMGAHIVAA